MAATVIFWPVALVGGAISYTEYEGEANKLMGNFWNHVDSVAMISGKPPETPPPPSPEPEEVDTKKCSDCGAVLPETWKACPYCGRATP